MTFRLEVCFTATSSMKEYGCQTGDLRDSEREMSVYQRIDQYTSQSLAGEYNNIIPDVLAACVTRRDGFNRDGVLREYDEGDYIPSDTVHSQLEKHKAILITQERIVTKISI